MNAATLRDFYRGMLRVRRTEERIAELYARQEMRCPVHLCIGQEAVAVGVCASMSPGDYVFSSHRSHGHYLAVGGDLRALLAELHGRATGCGGGRGGSMHLIDLATGFLGSAPIIASTIPIATGAAFGTLLRGENRVTTVFFGDAAVEEGTFHEALNFAALKRLPVVFVCENNLYSVQSPLSVRQPAERDIADLARAHGIEGWAGDGNDVMVVAKRAEAAVEKAREGKGPTLLEFRTYRWREHCGPNFDFDLGYRGEAEAAEWLRRDPIAHLGDLLLREGLATPAQLDAVARELSEEIEEAFAFARNSPFPEEEELFRHVYAD